jgi:hypothetical protein
MQARFPHSPLRAWLAILLAGGVLACAGAPADAQAVRAGSVRIFLRPSRTTLPADGKSKARILIEVKDRNNQALADGTPILCHSDTALLSTDGGDTRQSLTVSSEGGYATVYCQSEEAGPATVVVKVQDSSNQVVLDFLAEGEAESGQARVVNIRGGWVGYSMDLNTIRARDSARAQLGAIVIDAADGLELDLQTQVLKAWGVRMTRGKDTLEGEDVYVDVAGGRGVMRRFGDEGVERVFFLLRNLKPCSTPWEIPDDAFRTGQEEGSTWLVCKSCSYFVGQRVVVRHAALYTEGQKVFSFPPYWVIGLAGYSGASNSQVLGVSSQGGLAVDFPFFFSVSDEWSGSIKLQRGVTGSSFIARDGWSLGLAEEYDTGKAKGAIEVGGLLRDDWGIEWRDERRLFGEDDGFFNVAWPDHRSLFADASIYHYARNYRLSLRGQYDNPRDADDNFSLGVDFLTEPRRLGKAATFRLGSSVGTRRRASENHQWVLENELYGSVDLNGWRLGRHTRVRPSISNVYNWDTYEYSANSLRGELRMNRDFGATARLGLNYSVTYNSGDASNTGVGHELGLDFAMAHGAKWDASLSGSWDMSSGDTYGYGAIDYFLRPEWRLGIIGTHYEFDSTKFSDLEFELARSLGGRELGLRYSMDGHRISLEVGGLGLNKQ